MKVNTRFISLAVVLLFALNCVVLTNSTVCMAAEPTSKEVLKDFKNKISEFVASYTNNRKSDVHEVRGGWVSQYYEIADGYNIDVQATNSLISPYSATCEFKVIRHITEFHKTKIDAELDINYVKTDSIAHKHSYAYQDGEWVVVNRTHHTYIPLRTTTPIDIWNECSDYHGCYEKNIKANIVKKINSK